ncbi:agamous-like MADS-box protein AGL62 [Mercurialis annua]|uniref:agamous-like MADS-box protein AGL62 n=1 Tax=Mercurialis annua TaxID=3986 RepID=UPI00215F3226|nr:agamous-like MADS-box protein AGL62 [Mercurialis annua]
MDSTQTPTNQTPQRKTSRGRQKIEIKKVEKENSRYVTFSKRKNGIFKKATELSTLTGAEVAVLLFSEHGKIFSCGNPDVDTVLDRYLAEFKDGNDINIDESCLLEQHGVVTQATVEEHEFKRSLDRLEEVQRVAKSIMIGNNNDDNNEEFWWDDPIDNMNKDELEGFKSSLEELKKNVVARTDVMAADNAASESRIISHFIDQNGGWSSDFFNSNINGVGSGMFM